ncbi:Sporulation lipoprotein YhcN/YlaJ [Sporotomaculum syntrophicum]|uniref:Sporulation lipoprotein YhcN/YlaJ n=1 Tax=Sporotomaculum syntrophicum TaxID=182264 RepID=A0A9D3AX62_9FIRM|nr:YhcN/YlaJ family sporulation lipoprotein [Sporotomaculum syntrophicum]KAF1084056.1 Sporulation lipoprotein YhcN/YlaJ [Sporotomaculum syntrophicum]
MNKILKVVILCLIVCIMAGCAVVELPQRKPLAQMGQVSGPPYIHAELSEQVEEVAGDIQGVKDSTALVMNDQIAVAVKVTGFDRLHLKAIRQNLYNQVERTAPGYDVHVTTDKKLFAQLQMLKEQIKNAQQYSIPAQIKDSYNVIIEDMNG